MSYYFTINYVPNPSGSGKTTAATNYALNSSDNFLFVLPTQKVISEWMTKMPADECLAITSLTDPNDVISSIINFSKSPTHKNLFITHKALEILPMFHNKHNWHLIYDEVGQVTFVSKLNLPKNQNLIYDNFGVMSSDYINWYEVLPKHGRKHYVNEIARNRPNDDVWGVLQETYGRVANQSLYKTYMFKNKWDLGDGNFSFHSLLLPEQFTTNMPSVGTYGWKSVTLMAAYFEQTELYHTWIQMGVNFRKSTKIVPALSEHPKDVCNRIEIHNLAPEFSKSIREKQMVGDNAFGRYQDDVLDIVNNEKTLVIANNDIDDREFAGINFIRCPVVAHGINEYRDITNVVHFTSLNPYSEHYPFLKDVLGIEPEHHKTITALDTIYQGICRIALRDPQLVRDSGIDKIRVVVFDSLIANELAHRFDGCKLIDPFKGQARDRYADWNKSGIATTGKERITHMRQKQCEEAYLIDEISQMYHPLNYVTDPIYIPCVTENRGWHFSPALTIEANTASTTLEHIAFPDVDALIAELKEIAQDPITSKEENNLANGCVFRPANEEELKAWQQKVSEVRVWNEDNSDIIAERDQEIESAMKWNEAHPDQAKEVPKPLKRNAPAKPLKTRAQIIAINGIFLDIDDGEMAPEDMSFILKDYRHVIYNSANNGKDGKVKFRAYIPTQGYMSADLYEHIWEQLMNVIARMGYFVGTPANYLRHCTGKQKAGKEYLKFSGIDMSKKTTQSFFYLPSQSLIAGGSFFIEHNPGKMLDPKDFIKSLRTKDKIYFYKPYHNTITITGFQKLKDAIIALQKNEKKSIDYIEERFAEKLEQVGAHGDGSYRKTIYSAIRYYINQCEENDIDVDRYGIIRTVQRVAGPHLTGSRRDYALPSELHRTIDAIERE